MRNLLRFLGRYHVFILFVALEVCAYLLVVRNRGYHEASYLNSCNAATGWMYGLRAEVIGFLQLRPQNRRLAQENARLREQLQAYRMGDVGGVPAGWDSTRAQQFTYLPAQVVNGTVHRQSNYFTLDRGSLQGVRPDMGVITTNGVIGVVKDVSDNFCTVLTILHKDSRISARLTGTGYFGSLTWDGHDPSVMQLNDIPSHIEVVPGMEVATSGFSAIFPEGIHIGRVISFEQRPGESFFSIQVRLTDDMARAGAVYIIGKNTQAEQRALETQTEGTGE